MLFCYGLEIYGQVR